MPATQSTPKPALAAVTAPSNPIELDGHPAHERIDLAHLATWQTAVLLDELVERLRVEDGEDGFVDKALASRARRLARAASRLLSEPADEIDFDACEAEVRHG